MTTYHIELFGTSEDMPHEVKEMEYEMGAGAGSTLDCTISCTWKYICNYGIKPEIIDENKCPYNHTVVEPTTANKWLLNKRN